jgi:nitroimidazol reductase NimA-like FMN-containing flavoprotein (pyridoxamine 5'-phosphate oxidase superfamily)
MRRKDREMDDDFAKQVIDKAAFATLATVNEDGSPYCAPCLRCGTAIASIFIVRLKGRKAAL